MQTRNIKVGTKFKHMKEEWICTSNDGFIFEADCLNKNCPMKDLMLIGSSEEVEVIVHRLVNHVQVELMKMERAEQHILHSKGR